MSANYKRLTAIFIFSIPILSMFFLTAQVYLYDYESWVKYLLKIADKESLESYFKVEILSAQRFILLRYIVLLITVLTIFFSIFLFKRRLFISDTLKKDINLINNRFKTSFRVLNKTEAAILSFVFVFFVIRALFTILNTELQYDEAWTFVHFSSKGFLVSALSPNNNHQLYSLISSLLWKLDFDAKLAVRLPALIFSFLSLLTLFVLTNKVFGKKISIITTAILSVSIPFYFFSVLGRGYAPMLLFILLSSFSILKISYNNPSNNFLLRIYTISSIFGIYANPSFIYFWFVNLIVFGLLNYESKRLIYDFFKANLISLLISILLFLPMILAGGLGILGSASENNIETGNFLLYLHRLTDWLLLGFKWNLFFLLFGFAFLLLVINKSIFELPKQKNIYLLQLYWLWPFLIFLVSGIESPYRIWFWMPVFFWLHFVIIIEGLKLNRNIKMTIFVIVTLLNLYLSQCHYFMNWSLSLDRESKKIAQIILKENLGFIDCYTFSRYDKPLLDYYFLINKRSNKIYMPFQESKNYIAFETKIFDAVLLDTEDYKANDKELEILKNDYKVVYQNNRIKLYLSKVL
jgi:hypothetical protein